MNELGWKVRDYASAIGQRNTSAIYEAIQRGDIPFFTPPGTKTIRIPADWIQEQITEQLAQRSCAQRVAATKSATPPTHRSRLGGRVGVAMAGGDSEIHNNFYGSRMCGAMDGILRDAKDGTTKVTCPKCIDAVERISSDGP